VLATHFQFIKQEKARRGPARCDALSILHQHRGHAKEHSPKSRAMIVTSPVASCHSNSEQAFFSSIARLRVSSMMCSNGYESFSEISMVSYNILTVYVVGFGVASGKNGYAMLSQQELIEKIKRLPQDSFAEFEDPVDSPARREGILDRKDR
jgi:hypothetical protein